MAAATTCTDANFFCIKLFKQYTHNIAMTLYKINPLRIQKIPLTIKNYPWPCGSKLRSKLFISTMFFLAPLSPRREITVVLRISKRRRFLI